MLLQAACMARLGRLAYDKPFIVMALYIDYTGMVTRHLVFQPDSDCERVCTIESKQSCIFSLVLLGLLCLGPPRLETTVGFIYCSIRNLQLGIDDRK